MKRFKNILYIIDEESVHDHSIALKIAKLARINDARVTTMIINDSSFLGQIALQMSAKRDEISEAIVEQQKEQLSSFLSSNIWTGISSDMHLSTESNFIGIIQKVLKDKHDLVIKEENQYHGIDQLAMRLVRKCPCPVWVVKKQTSDFIKILGAIDVSSSNHETERLNKKIVELTHSLAQRENGESHFLHIWRLEHESMLKGPRFKMSNEEVTDIKEKMSKERLEHLESLLSSCHIDTKAEQIHLVEGKIVSTIHYIINKLDIDVLVMGSLGRSGIPGLFIGNKAETVLSTINCTVLTIKPDGFTSPVTIA